MQILSRFAFRKIDLSIPFFFILLIRIIIIYMKILFEKIRKNTYMLAISYKLTTNIRVVKLITNISNN